MTKLTTRIWNLLEDHPWFTMVAAVFAQTWFTLSNRALWFSDEVRYANAYENMVTHGNWMVLALNGQPYPDKPPVYFWFLWLLDTITPADPPTVFFLGAALSGLFFLMASYVLARTLGYNRTVSLAGILILLSTFLLAALFHYSRMDLMFAALIVLSHACFYKAFTSDEQGRYPVYAFLLAGVATLVKGPLGFIFPLLTCAIFLLWKGQFRRFLTRQMGLGLLAMVALLLVWITGVVLAEGVSFFIDTVLGKHVIQRATKTFHHREPFYYYIIAFPLAWLPWTLFTVVTPVKKAFSLAHWKDLWANRHQAGPHAFLWIMFGAAFVFLSSLSGKVLIYILPLFPPLAFLIANTLPALEEGRTRRFWTLVAVLWCAFGIGLLVAGTVLPFDVPMRDLSIASVAMLVCGGLIYSSRTAGFKTSLLCSALALTVWLYPVGLMVAPALDNTMSPKRQGIMIGKLADQGYTPMAYRIYSGIFTYYAGHNLAETSDRDTLNAMIANHDRLVLSIRDKHWDSWQDRPAELRILDKQNIAGMVYLIAIKD